jgi:hypothetical protein
LGLPPPPQTCPPLPIDENGKCPGIDARGGGLGLPPPPVEARYNVPTNVAKLQDGTCPSGYHSTDVQCEIDSQQKLPSGMCPSGTLLTTDDKCVTAVIPGTKQDALGGFIQLSPLKTHNTTSANPPPDTSKGFAGPNPTFPAETCLGEIHPGTVLIGNKCVHDARCPPGTTTIPGSGSDQCVRATPTTLPPPPPPVKQECVGEVYIDVHSNKCVTADLPKPDGSCVTGYEKSTTNNNLCEPAGFHCPAGTHVEGYSDTGRGSCVSNEKFLPRAPGDPLNQPPSCAPGWHIVGSGCLPDESSTPTTQTGNTGGTTPPAGQGGFHVLVNPNGDGSCPTGSHKFGAVCEKDQ